MTEDAKSHADESTEMKTSAEATTNEPDTSKTDREADEATVTTTDNDQKDATSEKITGDDENTNTADTTEPSVVADADGDSDREQAVKAETAESGEKATEVGAAKGNKKVAEAEIVKADTEATQKKEENSKSSAEFQAEVREQIENCKFEIISALQESIHTDLRRSSEQQIRKIERRRKAGVIVRDIIILLLAMVVGYFGYCLYDAEYFDFLKKDCDVVSCVNSNSEPEPEPEIVKDLAWYKQNYGYLFDGIQTHLSADNVDAYYLYSGDYKVSEIPANYLLSMAYGRLGDYNIITESGVNLSAERLRVAYTETFGNADGYVKRSFTHRCVDFVYDQASDMFVSNNANCAQDSTREILEKVEDIYEEGNVLYFTTAAAVYDKSEGSYYTFDNLFKPVAKNATEDDFDKYTGLMNHYQYQFNKVDNNYYFRGITKLN